MTPHVRAPLEALAMPGKAPDLAVAIDEASMHYPRAFRRSRELYGAGVDKRSAFNRTSTQWMSF